MDFLCCNTGAVFSYISEYLNTDPEYLFEHDDTAVFRKGHRKKWFAVVMRISKRKLHLDSDETTEVLNIKQNPDEIALLVDHRGYFPAYHMNKKHWCSIILDGSVDIDEICFRIDKSFDLVK